MTRKTIVAIGAGVAIIGLIVVLVVTRPWLAFIDVRVDETLPSASTSTSSSTAAPVEPKETGTSATAAPSEAVRLRSGEFISHEHETSGSVRIVENPDGTRVLAIENLATTNGPDVHVWLSASDVVEGVDGWFVAGGADFVDLGPIKGNLGNQVYDLPADVDLDQYPSVALWCVQFGVSFGAAQLIS
jgi:hypothetical protein